jgi:carboxyl-terminal processing protease
MRKKRFSALALAALCTFSFAIGICLSAYAIVIRYGGPDAFPYTTKFASVLTSLEKNYIGQTDMEEVSDAAYTAMVAAINDRWSYYMTAQEYEEYLQYQKNNYNGIGVTIEKDEESSYLRVISVSEDSPAQRAGVKAGDLMIKIDGVDLKGMEAGQVRELIAEKSGEDFTLSLKFENEPERSITISAQPIFSNPVQYELLDSGIGYVKIKNFEGECADRSIAAIDELIAMGAKGIVFDVRNNPGGLLSELVKILDYLLPEGTVFISRDKDGNESLKTSDAAFIDLPFAVLINENSYSAAEFFAAALSEYERADTFGEQTTGKSRSQINIVLNDGSAIHLSVNSYLTPKGVDLAEIGGLSPDIQIEMPDELSAALMAGTLPYEEDVQLAAAIKQLQGFPDK